MAPRPQGELTRGIRLHHATAMVVGTIIGASIFVQPSEITGPVPSLLGAALVWLTAGLLTFLGALVAAELASTFTESGGVYVYLREAFSPVMGFLWGWAMFWTMHTGIIAAIAMVFARYVGYFLPLGPLGLKLAAAAAILFLSWVNYLGVRQGSNLQTAFTAAKVAGHPPDDPRGVRPGWTVSPGGDRTGSLRPGRRGRRSPEHYRSRKCSRPGAPTGWRGSPRRGLPEGFPDCARGGTLRLRRLAHGDLQRRGNRGLQADDSAGPDPGSLHRNRVLYRPQRRVLLRAPPGHGDQLRTGWRPTPPTP